MRKERKKITRFKYRVTCHCTDGSSPQVTVWAESPKHAKIKATIKLKDKLIQTAYAEEVTV